MISGSKKQLVDLIKKRGAVTIDEASQATELAKTTLREHFLQLERDGLIKREFLRQGPGRPTLQYQLTGDGQKLYPSQEAKLLKGMLKFLKSEGEEKLIREFFESFWNKQLEKAERLMSEYPVEDTANRLETLSEILAEEGFMPECKVINKNGDVEIQECNCPFGEIVGETRLPCQLEAEFFQKLFGGNVERSSHIADGDFSCTYRLSGNNGGKKNRKAERK
jgi:predicted ArsR family transcriptional regulator